MSDVAPGQTPVTLTTEDIIEACRKPEGLNLFASILLGEVMEHPFPETHCAYWALLVRAALDQEFGLTQINRELKFALGLPRGTAKTTLMKLFVVWLIFYTSYPYYLVVSSNAKKAQNVIADVIGFLDNRNVKAIWGKWDAETEKETQALTIFKYNDKIRIVEALGAGSSVRGSNIRNERPGVIICEDTQDKECAESETLNADFIRWFVGTLYKARSYRRSLCVYIGNMYNEICLLNQLRQDSEWITLITAALLADGTSIWPTFRTKESILKEYKSDLNLGQGAIFLAEVMNDPTAMRSSWIDLTKIQHWPYAPSEPSFVNYLVIDPALGKDSSDWTSIALCGVFDGKCALRDVWSAKLDDTRTVEKGIELALTYHCSLIAIESVAYQATLANYFERTLRTRGISGIAVVKISPRGIPKVKRIENFLKKTISGDVLLHPNARNKIIHQASVFNPLKKDNVDDDLDSAAYGDQVLQEYWSEIYTVNNSNSYDADYENAHVRPASMSNCF